MKNFITIVFLTFVVSLQGQESKNLLDHYSKYYKQMQSQGDIQGVINALTHLNIIDPNEKRKDTLAVLYMNEGRFIQALNTIGVESLDSDSDMAVEVKAISLQSLNEIERALPHYEELFKRKPNPYIAYELADIKIQLNDFLGALKHITFGIGNSKDDCTGDGACWVFIKVWFNRFMYGMYPNAEQWRINLSFIALAFLGTIAVSYTHLTLPTSDLV